ncbi:hypothetical protein [Sedimenticola sp.]|uniref:hypothetical protein n=1 Tax=Sedimenticola sp. TaxID=1940285 RepID=UPI003D148D4E
MTPSILHAVQAQNNHHPGIRQRRPIDPNHLTISIGRTDEIKLKSAATDKEHFIPEKTGSNRGRILPLCTT